MSAVSNVAEESTTVAAAPPPGAAGDRAAPWAHQNMPQQQPALCQVGLASCYAMAAMEALQGQQPLDQPSAALRQLQQQLQVEAKAREELEDMLLCYERQLKAEMAARQHAEQALADAQHWMDSSGRQARQHSASLAAEQEAVQQERAALETMRADFERQLQTARAEVAKAQATMAHNEERMRASAAAERSLLVAEYEGQLAAAAGEAESLQQELQHRTTLMQAEMEKWKRQAALTAAAVMEAKTEVTERKRELDTTKDRMDLLIEKLYAGREANLSLAGAIAAASMYHSRWHQQAADSSLAGRSSCGGAKAAHHRPLIMGPATGWQQQQQHMSSSQLFLDGPPAGMGAATSQPHAGSKHQQRPHAGDQRQQAAAAGCRGSLNTQPVKAAGGGSYSKLHKQQGGAALTPTLVMQRQQAQQQQAQQQQQQLQTHHQLQQPEVVSPLFRSRIPQWSVGGNGPGSTAAGSLGDRQQHQQRSPASASRMEPAAGSSIRALTAGHVGQHRQPEQALKSSKKARQHRQQLPDRFAEGARNSAMITAMACRW